MRSIPGPTDKMSVTDLYSNLVARIFPGAEFKKEEETDSIKPVDFSQRETLKV
jgi:hypothetical protein